MTYRPAVVVEIDDDDDGSFSLDVSADRLAHAFELGLALEVDVDALVTLPAAGSLVLNNGGGTYDINAQRRVPHRVRIRHRYENSTESLWEGRVLPPTLETMSGLAIARFPLEGRQAARFRETMFINEQDATAFPAWLTATLGAGRYEFAPTPVTSPTMIQPSEFEGPRAEYVQQLARFSGSYVFEDHLGLPNVIEPARAATALVRTGSEVTLTAGGYRTLRESRFEEREELVRNHAVFRRETPAGSMTIRHRLTGDVPDTGGIDLVYNAPPGSTVVDGSWVVLPNPEELGPGNTGINVQPASITRASDGSTLTLTYTSSQLVRNFPYVVDVVLTLNTAASLTERVFRNDTSIATYDQRPMQLPPWLVAADYPNMQAWLDLRAQPLKVAVLDLPLWQEDEARSIDVARLQPGSTVVVDVHGANSLQVNSRMLIVGQQIAHDYLAMPTSRLYCIETLALAHTAWRWSDTWDNPLPWDTP